MKNAKLAARDQFVCLAIAFSTTFLNSCQEEVESSISTEPSSSESIEASPVSGSIESADSSSIAGSLEIILTPKDGVPISSVANAKVVADGRPEIEGKSDANGVVNMQNILPGALTINVLSADESGAALIGGASAKYGIRLPGVVVKSGQATDLGNQVMKETGSISGTIAIYSNPNNLSLVGTQIFVPGTSFSAFAAENGAFKMSGLPEGEYDVYAMKDGFATLKISGIRVDEAQDTEVGSLALSLSNGPEGSVNIVADSTASIGGISSKIETSFSRTVEFSLVFDSDAALMKVSDEPAFINKEWEPVAKNKTMTFTSDGLKRVYVMYSDLNGLESSPYYDRVYIDTEVPTIGAFNIMNGWAQTASLQVFTDMTASDSSTGIQAINFSGCVPSGGAEGAWVSYSTSMTCTLSSSGDGAKTVTISVKDFAGHISQSATDNITKGSVTSIHPKTYDREVVLSAAQQPYEIASNLTFSAGLTFNAGAVLRIGSGVTVTIIGKLNSGGTAQSSVLIEQSNQIQNGNCNSMGGSSDGYILDMSGNEPDATSAGLVAYTTFRSASLKLAGGNFSNVTFDSGCASGAKQFVSKWGLDPLVIQDSNFIRMSTAIQVRGGIGATTFRRNSGSTNTLLDQILPARNTILHNNTMTLLGGSLYNSDGGSFTTTGNTFSGTVNGLMFISNNESATVSGIQFGPTVTGAVFNKTGTGHLTLADMTVSGSCASLLSASGSANVTLQRVTSTSCSKGISFNQSYSGRTTKTVEIDDSVIGVSHTLVEFFGGDTAYTANIHDSDIACTNASGFCDFLYKETPSATSNDIYLLSNNIIMCNGSGTVGCRGFVFYKQSHSTHSGANGTFDLTLAGNTWTGKSPTIPIVTESVQGSSYSDMNGI
jgi:hypothetical protein